MPIYRAYFLDAADRICAFDEVDQVDDATAITAITAKYPDRAIELWQQDRVVSRLAGKPSPLASPIMWQGPSPLR